MFVIAGVLDDEKVVIGVAKRGNRNCQCCCHHPNGQSAVVKAADDARWWREDGRCWKISCNLQ